MRKRKNSDWKLEIDWQAVLFYILMLALAISITSPLWLIAIDRIGHRQSRVLWEGTVEHIYSDLDGDGAFAVVSDGSSSYIVKLESRGYFPSVGDRVIRVKYRGGLKQWGSVYTHFSPKRDE